MTFEQTLELLALVSIIVLPALAITLRIALKPVVEAILGLSEGLDRPPATAAANVAPAALEPVYEELGELRRRLADLQQAEVFYQGLLQPAAPSVPEHPMGKAPMDEPAHA